MKKILALMLILALLLPGCGGNQVPETLPAEQPVPTTEVPAETASPTEAPTAPPTEAPTEAPTEPIVYTNPLNGEILEAPYTGRIFASTISNTPDAIPHVGVNQADILMEMFVNGTNVRCLALFSDVSQVESIGSTRSTRLMFSDIAEHYDAILCHAYGSPTAINDANDRGLDHLNLDAWADPQYYSFRDPKRKSTIGHVHSLMGYGPGMVEYAINSGMEVSRPAGRDYGLRFTENAAPEEGEEARNITILLTYEDIQKETAMRFDPALGKYVFFQYGQEMTDGNTGEKEAFTNVIVMYAPISTRKGSGTTYHTADFLAGGEGRFACGGRIVPITWTCDGEDQPFRFFTENGEELRLGVGNTYMAICTADSPVIW